MTSAFAEYLELRERFAVTRELAQSALSWAQPLAVEALGIHTRRQTLVEAELPVGYVGAEVLRQPTTPWCMGYQLAFGAPFSAGLMLRWPPEDGQRGGRNVVCGPWHSFADWTHQGITRLGVTVRQPDHAGAIVGRLFALVAPPVYADLSGEAAGDAELALIEMANAMRSRPIGPWQPPDGRGIDAYLDQLYHIARQSDYGDGSGGLDDVLTHTVKDAAPWATAPRYYRDWNNRIAEIAPGGALAFRGFPKGLGHADVGDAVWFTGAASGTQAGRVTMLHATTWIQWREGRLSLLSGVYWTSARAQPVDSGAVMWNEEGYAIGHVSGGFRGQSIVTPYQPGLRRLLGPARARALRLDE